MRRRIGAVASLAIASGAIAWILLSGRQPAPPHDGSQPAFQPREVFDTSGFAVIERFVPKVAPPAAPEALAAAWQNAGERAATQLQSELADEGLSASERIERLVLLASVLNFDGQAREALAKLDEARKLFEGNAELARQHFATLAFLQGVTALRCGENENCIACRGECSCILPIVPAAVHQFPDGSRLAIRHFTDYLEQFPEDLEARWLLNVAHMTLGEHPHKVDPRYCIALDRFQQSSGALGRFRDIGAAAGLNRFNQAGGAILEDFDCDGLLDVAVTTMDPTTSMAVFRNRGDGTFAESTGSAGVERQFGGLNCMQTDYNNDGYPDVFIVRGAWLQQPMRPSLLRNNGDFTFTDVTEQAGLAEPANSIAAAWADYDNDGWLDVLVCCESQPSRLYRNLADGRFREVSLAAGLPIDRIGCKGAAWIDFDNDGYSDLFLNYLTPTGGAQLFRNQGNGVFQDVTAQHRINGPVWGFSCWAFDYDNDGWLDLFASCYDRSLAGVVHGLLGEGHGHRGGRLYRNRQGTGFDDVTKEAGLDAVYAAMGSNYGDFDNDGWLDFYVGTGEPSLATLVPNRMFRNLDGSRFVEVTAETGTGHLQKGHGVAAGDVDRDGDNDLFLQMGGATNGDRYHNVLFQNPGNANHSLTVKLIGRKTNRAAIGARLTLETSEGGARTIQRHVATGSSFGANPFEQTIGLGRASRVARLTIHWPASQTTQVFEDIAADQSLVIAEFADSYRILHRAGQLAAE